MHRRPRVRPGDWRTFVLPPVRYTDPAAMRAVGRGLLGQVTLPVTLAPASGSPASQRLDQVLDAFTRCVARYGFEGTTLQRVADEAGMTPQPPPPLRGQSRRPARAVRPAPHQQVRRPGEAARPRRSRRTARTSPDRLPLRRGHGTRRRQRHHRRHPGRRALRRHAPRTHPYRFTRPCRSRRHRRHQRRLERTHHLRPSRSRSDLPGHRPLWPPPSAGSTPTSKKSSGRPSSKPPSRTWPTATPTQRPTDPPRSTPRSSQ